MQYKFQVEGHEPYYKEIDLGRKIGPLDDPVQDGAKEAVL